MRYLSKIIPLVMHQVIFSILLIAHISGYEVSNSYGIPRVLIQ